MLFTFHVKLKRHVQRYFHIKENFLIKMDESSCQKSATTLTFANSYGLYSAGFLKIL